MLVMHLLETDNVCSSIIYIAFKFSQVRPCPLCEAIYKKGEIIFGEPCIL